MMLRILDRYILKRFLLLLAGTLVSLQFLFVFMDFIGNLDRFLNVTKLYTVLYYLYMLPYITVVIFPIAMLLAIMFTTGILAMNNEISAMQSAGVSIKRITMPLFLVSTFLCVGILIFSETILPECNRRKTEIYDYKIKNRDPNATMVKRNFYYQGKQNVMYRIGEFNKTESRGKQVIIEVYESDRMLYSIIADSLVWNTGTWTLYKGSKTIFEREGPRQEQFTVLKNLPFTDTPDDFLVTKKSPDDMDFFELREYIDQVRRSGGEAFSYLADLHFKISYPFINLIVVLLGVALTTKVGRQGLARVFGVGITICFIYYLFAKLGLAFGHSGDIQPVLAAWLGNIVFLLFGLGLFVRTSR